MKCIDGIKNYFLYNEVAIWFKYMMARLYPSHINEHISTLYKYALECSHITELGTHKFKTVTSSGISTRAFILGLIDSTVLRPKALVGVDLKYNSEIDYIENCCYYNNIKYHFYETNHLNEEDLEKTDLLFIDSWHVYGHLKRELAKYHSKVRKYIILHHTTIDGIVGESIRMKYDIKKQMKESGYEYEEITRGIWEAIEEFLILHPEFYIKERFTNNNGLTIIQRQ